MKKITIILQITIDEDNIAEKYPNFKANFEDIEQFTEAIINNFDSPVEFEGKPIDYLETYGYEVAIMDKKEGPWQS